MKRIRKNKLDEMNQKKCGRFTKGNQNCIIKLMKEEWE